MYTIDRRLHCWQRLNDIVLLGHSFGGTIIAKVEAIPDCIRRLIFLDFVLNDGESLRDSLPHHQALFDSLENRTIIRWPFELGEKFLNDADLELARSSYAIIT